MLTAAITAAIAAVFRVFGITLSLYTLGAIAIGVKVVIVAVGLLFGTRWLRSREAKNAAKNAAKKNAAETAAQLTAEAGKNPPG